MKRTVDIVPEAGLHARPASKFVETVGEYEADIKISDPSTDDEPVNAGSMLAVTGLGLKQGDEMRIEAEGKDAEKALNALEEIITTKEE